MKDRIWDIVGSLTGVVFVVLVFISVAIAGDIRDYVDDDSIFRTSAAEAANVLEDRRDEVRTSSFINLFGLLFFFGFLAYFCSLLQKAEGEDGWFTSMAYGGGLVHAAVILGCLSLELATTAVMDYGPDTQVTKALIALEWWYLWVLAPPMIAFILGASLVIVRYAALPRWIGWIGFPVAVTLFVPWFGFCGAMAWVLVVSIILLVQALRAPQPKEAN